MIDDEDEGEAVKRKKIVKKKRIESAGIQLRNRRNIKQAN